MTILNEMLEDYQEYMEDEALDDFLDMLWSSTYGLRTYKKNYTFNLNPELLKFNDELISLFEPYQVIEVKYAKSYYNDKPSSIDMIRIHINNMFMYLTYKDVYLSKEYYEQLIMPKRLYYDVIEDIKLNGSVDINKVKDKLNEHNNKLNELLENRIQKKIELKFDDYKELINGYIYRLFNNYKAPNTYANEFGWEINTATDAWSEDNYVVKYFSKSLTGYMQMYVRDSKPKEVLTINCKSCNTIITPQSNRQKYCKKCVKEKERVRKLKNWHKYKSKYKTS